MKYVVIIQRLAEGETHHTSGKDKTFSYECESVDECKKHIEETDMYVILDKEIPSLIEMDF